MNQQEFYDTTYMHSGEDGDKIRYRPPLYYYSLSDAMENYYDTFKTIGSQSYPFTCDVQGYNTNQVGMNFGVEGQTVGCVLGFHRFFELFLKDLLSRVNPNLAFITSDEQNTIKLIKDGKYDEIIISDTQTIEFKKAYTRLKAFLVLKKSSPNDNRLHQIGQYRFLLNFLKHLNYLRNSIYHDGAKLPNIYHLDYMVTQHLSFLLSDEYSKTKGKHLAIINLVLQKAPEG